MVAIWSWTDLAFTMENDGTGTFAGAASVDIPDGVSLQRVITFGGQVIWSEQNGSSVGTPISAGLWVDFEVEVRWAGGGYTAHRREISVNPLQQGTQQTIGFKRLTLWEIPPSLYEVDADTRRRSDGTLSLVVGGHATPITKDDDTIVPDVPNAGGRIRARVLTSA